MASSSLTQDGCLLIWQFLQFHSRCQIGEHPASISLTLEMRLHEEQLKKDPGTEKTKGRHGSCLQISERPSSMWNRVRLTLREPRGKEGSRFQDIKSRNHVLAARRSVSSPHWRDSNRGSGTMVGDIPQGSLVSRPLWSFLQDTGWNLVHLLISSMGLLAWAWLSQTAQDSQNWTVWAVLPWWG